MSNISVQNVEKQRVFQNRNYIFLVLANVVNRFGDSVDSIVFTWLTYSLTGSAAFSALVYAANKLPTVLLQPVTGAFLEKKKKKNIMIITDILRALLVSYILLRLFTGLPTAVEMLIFTFLISTVEAFRQPAGSSILPMIVSKEQYAEAVSYQSGCGSAAELIGLGAGAVLIGAIGNTGAVMIDVTTFIISALFLACMKIEEVHSQETEKFSVRKLFCELGDGANVVKKSHTMRYLIVLVIILNALLVPYNSLQAAMTSEVLHSGEKILSLVGVTLSLGMICGSLAYPTISRFVSKRYLLMGGSFLFGFLYLGTAAIGAGIQSPMGVYLAEGMLTFLVGIGVALINTFASVSIVQKCDKNYLARMSGLMGSAGAAVTPLVSILVSVTVGMISTTTFFIISGILTLLVCFTIFNRKIMPVEFMEKNETF